MEFINKLLDYLSANPALTLVLVACVVFIAIVITVICVLSAKAKKARKRLASTPTESKPTASNTETEKTIENPVQEETEKATEEVKPISPTPEPVQDENLQKEEPQKSVVVKEPTPTEEKTIVEPKKTETPPKKAPNTVKNTSKTEPVKPAKSVENEPITPPKTEEKNVKVDKRRYTGKWTICHLVTKEGNQEEDLEETYFFELHASNGEKLLSSEEYTSYSGVLKGIETHKANILKNNFRIGLTKKGEYIFKLLNGKNTLLCTGENYPTKIRCERAIESTKRFAETAIVDENVHDIFVQIPFEVEETPTQEIDNGYVGKWIISKTVAPDGDEVYYFELFASNGEKLLSSEEYTSYVGALNGINTHKNNIEKDLFRIAFTKRGDYIYKLLSSNGQLLCLGEHYKTKRRCENAVESVKRFAKNAPILTAANIVNKE